jgi:hypothetical protein
MTKSEVVVKVTAYTFATILVVGTMLIFGLIFSIPFWALWNWLLPTIFGLPKITIVQAFGLSLFIFLIKSQKLDYKPKKDIDENKSGISHKPEQEDLSFQDVVDIVSKKYQA